MIVRWLEALDARDVSAAQSSTALVVRGEGPAGGVVARLCGLTPNSIYSTGEFAALTLRLDVGTRPATLDAYGARTEAGALWLASVGGGYRGAVLSGLDPLNPLDRLSSRQIERFLSWAAELASNDAGRARGLVHDACCETADSLGRWAQVGLAWRTAADRAATAEVGAVLRESRFFDSIREGRGGRVGSVVVSGRFVARAGATSAHPLEIAVDLFRPLVPEPSLALDDLVADVNALRASVELAPTQWLVVRATSDQEIGLEGTPGLYPVGRGSYAGWIDYDEGDADRLADLLSDVRRRVRPHLAGPYR